MVAGRLVYPSDPVHDNDRPCGTLTNPVQHLVKAKTDSGQSFSDVRTKGENLPICYATGDISASDPVMGKKRKTVSAASLVNYGRVHSHLAKGMHSVKHAHLPEMAYIMDVTYYSNNFH